MNVLWLSSPFRKDDILTNKDAVWVYTENELREGGGEMREFMRSAENCHPLITRETIGKDGYYLSLIQSDAADEEDSVDLGGRRIIKKKTKKNKRRAKIKEHKKQNKERTNRQ